MADEIPNVPIKRTTYALVSWGVTEIKPTENNGQGGVLLEFYHPQTGELIDFPMSHEDAAKMGKDLLGQKDAPASEPPDEAAPASSPDPIH